MEGKYRVKRELGVGGMGRVYLAQHEQIERPVAIKVLHQDLASDEAVRRRFETEAKAIARLRHPNCVMLYEFGYSEEIEALFAVFEYVEGKSLEAWVGKQLPVGDIVHAGRQVAEGISHAHKQKIIHRDLKPENIMVVADEAEQNIKVLDFGIARIAEDDEKRTRLTQMGQMFGTPPYMSPEQVRAKLNVTFATDIYAIGVILYEMLEGRLPFLGDTPIETVMMHLNEEVPPFEREGVPEELQQIVLRCLEKEAEDRFESCRALGEALKALDVDSPQPLELTAAAFEEEDDAEDEEVSREELASAPTMVAPPDDNLPVDAPESDASDEEEALEALGEDEAPAPADESQSSEESVVDDGEDESDEIAAIVAPVESESGPEQSERVSTFVEISDNHRPLIIGLAVAIVAVVVVAVVAVMFLSSDDAADGVAEDEAEQQALIDREQDAQRDEPPQVDEAVEQDDGDSELPLASDDSEEYDGEVSDPDPSEEGDEAEPVEEEDEQEASDPQRDPVVPAAEEPTPSPAPEREPTAAAGSPSAEDDAGDAEEDAEEEAEEASQQPDAIRLERRRRGADQDDEEQLEEPAGIGLPERN